jgi:small subunit ribosomal protein S18
MHKPRPSRSTGARKRSFRFGEPTKCRFCRDSVKEIDYKDTASLQKLVSSQGKLFARKRSGNCARHQRSAKKAVKRARFMALMPYVG